MANPLDPLAQFRDPRRPHSRHARHGENVSKLIEEEERLEKLEVALHQEVAEFLQATTRMAAQVIGNLKQRTREMTDDAVVMEMREFIETVSRKAEYLIQELVRRHEQEVRFGYSSAKRNPQPSNDQGRKTRPLPKAARTRPTEGKRMIRKPAPEGGVQRQNGQATQGSPPPRNAPRPTGNAARPVRRPPEVPSHDPQPPVRRPKGPPRP